MEIKYREVVVVYLLIFVTLGIYWIYWLIQTKKKLISLVEISQPVGCSLYQ